MDEIISLLNLDNIVEIFKTIFSKVIDGILAFLPNSPFQYIVQNMTSLPYLPVLNWFFPIAEIAYVTELWLIAIGLYYGISALLRFVKAIR